MISKFLLLFNLITLCLYATAVDSKIVDANNSTLRMMLKKLETKSPENSELQLQKIVLQKILSLEKQHNYDTNVSIVVKSQKEYANLIKNYLLDVKELYKTKKALKDTKNTLNILQEKIQDSNGTLETTLTQQLQYSYYKKKSFVDNKTIARLQKRVDIEQNLVYKNIKLIKFDDKEISTSLQKTDTNQSKLGKLLLKLKLEREKYVFLDNDKKSRETLKKIQLQQRALQKLLQRKLLEQLLFFSVQLQQKNKKIFEFEKEIQKTLKTLILPDGSSKTLSRFVYSLASKQMGLLKTVTASTNQSIQNSLDSIMKILNKPLFSINKIQVSSLKLIIALVIFLLGFFIGGAYKKYIKHLSTHNNVVSISTRTLLSNLGYYIIIVIAFFISLNVLGVNLSSITLVAGALSVGIGFGLQNIVSNFVSGIILMFEKSVKVDDYVQLSDSLRGRISDIRMRSTVITTNENIDVIVPNQNFIQNNVINWTMNDTIKRFEIPFSVAYGTDANKVIQVVLAAVGNSHFNNIYTSKERKTRVVMREMGDSSVNFELFIWIKGKETLYPKQTTSKFLILIYNALNENNISIPFPQLDLHIKKG